VRACVCFGGVFLSFPYVYTYTSIYIRVYNKYLCMNTYICIHIHVCICVYMYMHIICTYTWVCICIYAYANCMYMIYTIQGRHT